ncbi:hypothetical protein L4D00_15390 [Photobacterium swingsii]|uniref:Uncharacterized protein n=1 Tax=Photobacterium swingsii TaxID=680026 RepID=A0A0J8VCI2_9GAMM|nr:hypothetical protein [Photobacterium swingsii]KMV31021.1 hypothetical protein AB733_08445 [Photobacterium swingsii]PSW23506.1 hypothetical protein C9I94_15395 [Photobacterium swingsii]
MAITIRNVDKHYYMIEDLKQLTNNKVTTKALIKGGYMAVELGNQLKEEQAAHQQTKDELLKLKEVVSNYLHHHNALANSIK